VIRVECFVRYTLAREHLLENNKTRRSKTTMKKINYLPGFLGAVGILAVLFMLEILAVYAFYDIGIVYHYGDPAGSVILVFAFGIVLSVLMHFSGLSYSELFHPSNNSVAMTMTVLSIPVAVFAIGCLWWLAEIGYFIVSLFPEDKESLEMLTTLMNSGVASIIALCLIAPFIEEMLFRGIILRGFLGRYSPGIAIVGSAALFGLIHMNIYQIPVAFIFGCFAGWLFYASRSLWPCILAHALYNAGSYYLAVNSANFEESNAVANLVSLVFSAFALYVLYKLTSYKAVRVSAGDDNEG
jgi:uncharacterized protein